jgi:hypothetical protein
MRLGAEGVYLLLILGLGTRWGEWSASRPVRAFTPGERTPGTHCTGGWVGPRAGLNTEARGIILYPCRGSIPDRQVVQPVVRHYTAWANPAPCTVWWPGIKNSPTVTHHVVKGDWNGYPVPGGTAGHPVFGGHKYGYLVLQVGGWALD